jgi:HK97 family phage major capsid protein|nr:MAG TPA: major capsid protein [Caudoviricetes sp.]
MKYKQLIEKRNALIEEMEKMVEACETETRAFSEDENKRYEETTKELNDLDATLKAADELDEKRSYQPIEKPDETKDRAELEERAFESYIRGTLDLETRADVNLTKSDNGAVIPSSIANKIIEKVKEMSPLFAMATHYNVGGTLTIPSYDESTQKITMAYATEFATIDSTSGKFTSISLTGFLAGARSLVSKSLVNNSQFDLVPFVVRKMAEAAAYWIENQLINGTTSKIEGLSKVAASVTAASATAVTADELIDLQETIPDVYQGGCIWVMSKATRTAIRKLKDGQNNYLLNKDATSRWGYTLFGKDVYISDNMPDMAAGKRAILYLDPTGLAVKMTETPSVEVLREKYADQHAIGVICWMELDSKVENAQKIAALAMKAG